VPGQGLTGEEGSCRGNTGPVLDSFDKILLAALAEAVLEPLHLGRFFVADENHRVAALEDWFAPAGEAVDLPRQVAVDVFHKIRDLLDIFDVEEEVYVVREHRDIAYPDRMEPLGSSAD
jgi:hypothetical protein